MRVGVGGGGAGEGGGGGLVFRAGTHTTDTEVLSFGDPLTAP